MTDIDVLYMYLNEDAREQLVNEGLGFLDKSRAKLNSRAGYLGKDVKTVARDVKGAIGKPKPVRRSFADAAKAIGNKRNLSKTFGQPKRQRSF